jgi:hypothetical protein
MDTISPTTTKSVIDTAAGSLGCHQLQLLAIQAKATRADDVA